MTWRAVLAGLVAGAFVCAFCYFNDAMMHQTMFIGNNMPISVYGGLILFVFLLNPLLKRWAFSARELAVALTLVLAMCCIPGAGLMRTFTVTLMMPWQWERSTPGWRAEGIVETAPRQMLASPGNNGDALNGFVRGIGNGRGLPNLREVPWQAWRATLVFWIPLILLLWIGLVGLALVVHRQWSEHEHLRYPLATFSNALLPEAGKRWGAVLGDRLFWIGAVVVFLIHFNNYLAVWFPEYLVTVPTKVDLSSLVSLFPTFAAGGGDVYLQPTVYFTVLAFGVLPGLGRVIGDGARAVPLSADGRGAGRLRGFAHRRRNVRAERAELHEPRRLFRPAAGDPVHRAALLRPDVAAGDHDSDGRGARAGSVWGARRVSDLRGALRLQSRLRGPGLAAGAPVHGADLHALPRHRPAHRGDRRVHDPAVLVPLRHALGAFRRAGAWSEGCIDHAHAVGGAGR